MLRVKRNLCSSQVSLSNLSFLLFERLTVPGDLVHFTVGAQFEKVEINRIESVRIAGANRQQRSSIAMTEKRDIKLGLATVDNATDVAVLFVDKFFTRFGIAQVKLAAAGSRVLQQPRWRPVFKLISWQQ